MFRPLPLLALVASTAAHAHGTSSHHHDPAPATGHVLVVNDSGATIEVALGDRTPRVVLPGDELLLAARPGEVSVQATYDLFDTRQLLLSTRTVVRPNRTTVVTVEPEDHAHVLVENDTRFDAELYVEGAWVASFEAGETELVSVPSGWIDLELRMRSGRPLESTSFRARPYAEHAWTVDLPVVGVVTVDNHYDLATRLMVDGELIGSMSPWTDRTVELSVGWHRIAVTDERGRIVLDEWYDVDSHAPLVISVPSRPASGHGGGSHAHDDVSDHDVEWEDHGHVSPGHHQRPPR